MTLDRVEKKKYGDTYRGIVINNIDPLKTGRLLVQVPDVMGFNPCFWAEPATPLAGLGSGLYMVALPGSGVWVKFEDGDTDRPFYTGFWRGDAKEMPAEALVSPPVIPVIVLGTPGQNVISLNDTNAPPFGGIVLRSGVAMISLDASGITLRYGPNQIVMNAAGVDINFGALHVTAT